MKKNDEGTAVFEARELTGEERAELQGLTGMPDETIDYSDVPRTTAADWAGAEVGKFYRPLKRQLTLRLDADLVDWFKRAGGDDKGYQTRINRALREYVTAHSKRAG